MDVIDFEEAKKHRALKRAAKLNCYIGGSPYGDDEEGLAPSGGSYWLYCEDCYHVIWDGGLSLAGIMAALDCLEREIQTRRVNPDADPGDAWSDFYDPGWEQTEQTP